MNPKPPGYSRTGLSVAHIRQALADGQWRSLPYLVSQLADKVTPEGARRRAAVQGYRHLTLEEAKEKVILEAVRRLTYPDNQRQAQVDQRQGTDGPEFQLREAYRPPRK